MLYLTSVLISICIIVIAVYLWYIRSSYEFFTRLNIPGPPPVFFFGNFLEVIKTRRLSLCIRKWTEQYGRIFGYFEGHTPILIVSDPDILQDIFIKSFSNFHSRRLFPLADQTVKSVNMFFATGLRWKRQRFIINPTFSSAKLKQMTPLIHRSLGELMKKMSEEAHKGQSFDIYAFYKRFTMDSIWSCGFGLDTDMQNNINDPYLVCSQQMFDENVNGGLLVLLALFISELNKFWRSVHLSLGDIRYWFRQYIPITRLFLSENPATWILQQAKKMIDEKQKMHLKNRTDLLQLMLESASNEEYIQDARGSDVNPEESEIEPPMIRKLTKYEIQSNIFLFSKFCFLHWLERRNIYRLVIAGYETTSTALSYITYVLATHPDEQLKLQHHIDEYFQPDSPDEMPSYELVSNMDYLDMLIREVLRMYPIAPLVINRQSSEIFEMKGFGTIPAGTRISIDIYQLHFDPELWGPVDPNEFYPERFATKRHPMAWIPFGAGPRNCVGMRFAFMEMKLAIVRLLKTYSVVSCGPETQKAVEQLKENFVIAPKELIVRLERRLHQS